MRLQRPILKYIRMLAALNNDTDDEFLGHIGDGARKMASLSKMNLILVALTAMGVIGLSLVTNAMTFVQSEASIGLWQAATAFGFAAFMMVPLVYIAITNYSRTTKMHRMIDGALKAEAELGKSLIELEAVNRLEEQKPLAT